MKSKPSIDTVLVLIFLKIDQMVNTLGISERCNISMSLHMAQKTQYQDFFFTLELNALMER